MKKEKKPKIRIKLFVLLIVGFAILVVIAMLLRSPYVDNGITKKERCLLVNEHDDVLDCIKYRYPEWTNAEYYTPSWSQAARAETIVYKYLKKSSDPYVSSLASKITEYRCQFIGVRNKGKTFLLCNYATKDAWDVMGYTRNDEWKKETVATWLIQDGGRNYFEAIVDMDRKKCVRLEIHYDA